jgi:formiminotetrahydrofolate cyclodeaminase
MENGGGALAARTLVATADVLAEIARESGDGGLVAQALHLRERAEPLAAETASAFAAALNATGGDHEVGRAYADAAKPPLQIAETAADAVALAVHVAECGPPASRADALAAALVAAGCAHAAAELVAVNLTVSANDDRVRLANALAEEAARTAEAARAARE